MIINSGTQTFLGTDKPLWWLGRWRESHVILGVDSELVLTPRHDIASCHLIVEDAIPHSLPCSFGWITLHHHVMEPIITPLIWRWSPGHCHCTWHIFINFNWTRRLGLICNQAKQTDFLRGEKKPLQAQFFHEKDFSLEWKASLSMEWLRLNRLTFLLSQANSQSKQW